MSATLAGVAPPTTQLAALAFDTALLRLSELVATGDAQDGVGILQGAAREIERARARVIGLEGQLSALRHAVYARLAPAVFGGAELPIVELLNQVAERLFGPSGRIPHVTSCDGNDYNGPRIVSGQTDRT